MTITVDELTGRSLTPELLERCRARAADHDRDGRFPRTDLEELRSAGYLLAAAPREMGGWGLDLADLAREQRRLARYAPATALSLCMHHYWVGLAADLDPTGAELPILGWVVAGDVLASGHGEAGNDVPVFLSTTMAERVPGGWRLQGRKRFGSLGSVWDRLGFHAMDATGADGPVIVHGFVSRSTPGVEVVPTWDAHGMRATESHDTVLDGAFVPDHDVLCVLPAGPNAHPVAGTMLAWALTLIGNVYVGIAERAFELAVADCRIRTSIAVPTGTMAGNPYLRHQVADMHLELDAARALLERLADDWCAGVDHGERWSVQILSSKWRAAQAAMRVVDLACEVVGGASFARGHELERLSRDVRAARFHPGTDAFTHEVIGSALVGAAPGSRW